MADLKYYDIISKPVITEKSMAGMELKKYTFYVHTLSLIHISEPTRP